MNRVEFSNYPREKAIGIKRDERPLLIRVGIYFCLWVGIELVIFSPFSILVRLHPTDPDQLFHPGSNPATWLIIAGGAAMFIVGSLFIVVCVVYLNRTKKAMQKVEIPRREGFEIPIESSSSVEGINRLASEAERETRGINQAAP